MFAHTKYRGILRLCVGILVLAKLCVDAIYYTQRPSSQRMPASSRPSATLLPCTFMQQTITSQNTQRSPGIRRSMSMLKRFMEARQKVSSTERPTERASERVHKCVCWYWVNRTYKFMPTCTALRGHRYDTRVNSRTETIACACILSHSSRCCGAWHAEDGQAQGQGQEGKGRNGKVIQQHWLHLRGKTGHSVQGPARSTRTRRRERSLSTSDSEHSHTSEDSDPPHRRALD